MKIVVRVLLPFVFILLSCSDIFGPGDSSTIRGKVTDSDGKPIGGAIIELSYNLSRTEKNGSELYFSMDNLNPQEYELNFYLPTSNLLLLWISKYNSSDKVKVFINEKHSGGRISKIWDITNLNGKKVISDFYEWHFESEDLSGSGIILLFNDYSDFDRTDNLEYFAKTDKNGNYEIKQSALAYNRNLVLSATSSTSSDVENYIVTRDIKIWALHNEYATEFIDSVNIDPEKGAVVNFKMVRK